MPRKSFDCTASVAEAPPPVFEIPVIVTLDDVVTVTKLPDAFPSWLLLMLTDDVTPPDWLIPVKLPDTPVMLMLRRTLLFRLSMDAAELLEIPRKVPPPALVAAMTLLPVIGTVPVPPVLVMPVKVETPVPSEEQFWIVFPVIDTAPVAALEIPVTFVDALGPLSAIDAAVEVLPIVLLPMVALAPAPAASMPRNVYPMPEADPVAIEPTTLFWIVAAPVVVA